MRNSPSRTLTRFVNFGYSGISPIYNKNTNLFDELFSRCPAWLVQLKVIIAKRWVGNKRIEVA